MYLRMQRTHRRMRIAMRLHICYTEITAEYFTERGKNMKRFLAAFLTAILLFLLAGCALPQTLPAPEPPNGSAADTVQDSTADTLDEHGAYTSKADVALFIHQYGRLPDNFITKKEAESLGWSGGSLEPYAPGKCIGGSRFGNYEGLLPNADGRRYTECDIDTLGAKSRGAKRIVFSNDGLIYYTDDHYEHFELLYGEE